MPPTADGVSGHDARNPSGVGRAPRVSVVLATYNRLPTLERLLRQLGEQTYPADDFEVVVVDDGSKEPVAPQLAALRTPFRLNLLVQQNGGAARARHHGVMNACGEILVILDDDMQIPPNFLELHVGLHRAAASRAVFGRYRSDPNIDQMPLFERWYADKWERWSADYAGGAKPSGASLCTGNVSLRREDYLRVGGFDLTLDRSEDAELGLKLEEHGVEMVYSEEAYTLHGSDHTAVATWMKRAFRYGINDLRVGRMHPRMIHADPFRYWDTLPRLSRPLLVTAVVAPGVSKQLAGVVMRGALGVDKLGARRSALKLCGLVFGMEYFRGMGDESGGVLGSLKARAEYLLKVANEEVPTPGLPRRRGLLVKALADLKADHGWYENRYSHHWGPHDRSFTRDFVEKVGLQMAAGYRLMRLFREAEMPTAAKLTSRLLRHLYGADIHWKAELAPAVMFVHGMGIAIHGAAKVGPRCVIAQNVTLGAGLDPQTRAEGSPTLEGDVRVGAGATLLGPITIGEGSKIMPGVVLMHSVPKNSLVESSPAVVRSRAQSPGSSEPEPGDS
jgi:serine acetyltransferase/glycosyltransferase involved in cell wall biosynthesis